MVDIKEKFENIKKKTIEIYTKYSILKKEYTRKLFKTLTVYTMKETLYPFLSGMFFFTFVFVIQLLPELFKLIVQNDAPIFKSLEIFVYMLPFNMGVTIPMSVLMAAIMGFGRLSSDNEIIVMRALGFSHLRIYKPIMVFGVIAFIGAFFFNNFIMSEANYRYRSLISYIVNIRPSVAVGEMEFRRIPDMNIYISAGTITKTNMLNVVLYEKNDADKKIITARTGEWFDNKANSTLIKLRLYDGVVQEMPGHGRISNDFTTFDTLDINIAREVQTMIGGHDRGLREISSFEIRKRIKELKRESDLTTESQVDNLVRTAYGYVTNEIAFEDFKKEYTKTNRAEIKKIEKANDTEIIPYYFKAEFNKFISIPAACLFMVLVGAPLGIVSKRSGKGFGFGMSVLVVALYYFLITGAEIVAGAKVLPPFVAMWLPNMVLFLIGSFFIVKSLFTRGK